MRADNDFYQGFEDNELSWSCLKQAIRQVSTTIFINQAPKSPDQDAYLIDGQLAYAMGGCTLIRLQGGTAHQRQACWNSYLQLYLQHKQLTLVSLI